MKKHILLIKYVEAKIITDKTIIQKKMINNHKQNINYEI